LGSPIPGETAAQRTVRLERTPVVIRGDRTSELGTTLEVLGMARAAGLTNVVMETKKKE
jgi:biopolymer transport protein ExbD